MTFHSRALLLALMLAPAALQAQTGRIIGTITDFARAPLTLVGVAEAVLADCDGVSEVAVIGVADPRWGEVGRAFIVARSGADVMRQPGASSATTSPMPGHPAAL